MNRWFALPAISAVLFSAGIAQAGTAGYYGTCYFLDRGDDNGGNVFGMPCYVVEGGNVNSAFFHLVMQDGRTLVLNATPEQPFTDLDTERTYSRIGSTTFSADADGDVVTVEDIQVVQDQRGIDDPDILEDLRNR